MKVFAHELSSLDPVGLSAVCRTCGPTVIGRAGGRWYCEFKVREYAARRDPEKRKRSRRKSKLLAKYGLTIEEWDALLIAQSGRCLICLDPMRDPHVDHDHGTGEVRGLLCQSCNLGLGHFRDRPDLLRAAADYVIGSENVSLSRT